MKRERSSRPAVAERPCRPRPLLAAATALALLLSAPVLGQNDGSARPGKQAPAGTAECPLKNDLFLNPFNRDSAHHRPIGTGAVYSADDDPFTRIIQQFDKFGINLGSTSWGLYTALAPSDGPMILVDRLNDRAKSLPVSVRMPPGGVTIEYPEGESDGNVAIWDAAQNRINHFRRYTWNDGAPKAMQYRDYDPHALGHGTYPGDRVGTSASGVAAPFGVLRGPEANTPGHPIQHALQMVVPRKNDGCPNVLAKSFILPAVDMDGSARTNAEHNQGLLPYGSLLAIPPEDKGGPNLDELKLSEAGRRLAQAVRDYGIYIVDGGGCSPAIRADQHVEKKLFMKEIPKFYRYIRVVTNSEWAPDRPTTGGGDPLAPNCAFDAP